MGKFCRNPGMQLGKRLAMFGRPEIILIGALVLLGLHAAGLYPYLLFFILAERFAIDRRLDHCPVTTEIGGSLCSPQANSNYRNSNVHNVFLATQI